MLKSRVRKLEQKLKQSKEDQVVIISISPKALSLLKRRSTDLSPNQPNEHDILNKPNETIDEFRERLGKEGKNMGIWVGLESEI